MKRKLLLMLVLICTISIMATGCGDPEKKAAKDAFKAERTRIEDMMASRDNAVTSAQTLLDEKGTPLYPEAITELEKAVAVANKLVPTIPDMPKKTSDINAATEKLKKIDYTEQIKLVTDKTADLEDQIARNTSLITPDEKKMIKKLKGIDEIVNVKAVTEDNDPNEQLGKQGGYYSQIYFESSLVDQSQLYADSDDVIDKGTDCGGSIEMYKTREEAETRDAYLGGFDGGALSSGSHYVFGTILVRTSCELKASEQKEFTRKIVYALSEAAKKK